MNRFDKLTEATILSLQNKLEEAKNSNNKYIQKFMNYCDGKVEDLGTLDTEDYGELQIALIDNNYSQAKPAYVLVEENLIVADKDGNIFIDTPMSDLTAEIANLEFDKIDTSIYNDVLDNWEDYALDYDMERNDNENIEDNKRVEFEKALPEHFKYNANGLNTEVYIDNKWWVGTPSNVSARTSEQSVDNTWQIPIYNNGKFINYEKVIGYQAMIQKLQDIINTDQVQDEKGPSHVTTSKGTFTVDEYRAKEEDVKQAYIKFYKNEISEEQLNSIIEDALNMLYKGDIETSEWEAKKELGLNA